MKTQQYDSKHEIHYIATNPCDMAAMNMEIFKDSCAKGYARAKTPKQKIQRAQTVYVIHPCKLVGKEHISISELQKADKVIVIGCYRKEDFRDLDNVEYWSIEDIQAKAAKLTFRTGNLARVRVNYGCNHRCSFCPIKRNQNYDRQIQELVEEIGDAKQVKLCSDDLASYRYGLKELIEALPDKKLDLTYVYPAYLIQHKEFFIQNRNRLSITIPMQSGSDRVLSLMNRGDYKSSEIIDVVRQLVNLRSQFIYGSPTESFEEFLQTFALERYFEHCIWFRYQAYEGTKWHRDYGFETSGQIERMEDYLLRHSKGCAIDWRRNESL